MYDYNVDRHIYICNAQARMGAMAMIEALKT
jgi:hypothetical protein